MSSSVASPRERILQTAGALFYRDGYRATGIDRVIAEAGVAKATLFRHFASKDDLILAWIARAEEQSQAIRPSATAPGAVMAYAAAMIAIARQSWCMGCTYQVGVAEYPDPAHPVHIAARAVKERVLDDLTARAVTDGLPAPRMVAEQVLVMLEGVWALVRMFGTEAPLDHVLAGIATLIDAARNARVT